MDSLIEAIRDVTAMGLSICVIAVIAMVVVAIRAYRRRREKYQQLHGQDGFTLRYCSSSRFLSWWKFFPWEGVGVLRVHGQELVFDAFPNKGDAFTVRGSVHELLFHGRRHWFRNGLLPWLLLKRDSGDYYLCVETGPLILGGGRGTRDLFASIKHRAERDGGGQPAKGPRVEMTFPTITVNPVAVRRSRIGLAMPRRCA